MRGNQFIDLCGYEKRHEQRVITPASVQLQLNFTSSPCLPTCTVLSSGLLLPGSSPLLLHDILLRTEGHTSSLEISTLLGAGHVLRSLARLPGRRAEVLEPVRILKHLLDLLERLAGRLGEQQEDVDEHGGVEHREDDVGAPLDVGERLGHEQTQRGVEGPVETGAQRDTLASELEGEELGRVDPGGRAHGDGEGGDEEVGAGDEALGGGAGDAHGLGGDAVDAALDDLAVLGEDAGVGGHPGAHEEASYEEGWATTPAIHPGYC